MSSHFAFDREAAHKAIHENKTLSTTRNLLFLADTSLWASERSVYLFTSAISPFNRLNPLTFTSEPLSTTLRRFGHEPKQAEHLYLEPHLRHIR